MSASRSSSEDAHARTFQPGDVLFVCEGGADCVFVEKLLEHRIDARIRTCDPKAGRDAIPKYIDGLHAKPGFDRLKHLFILVDNEDNPVPNFRRLRKELLKYGNLRFVPPDEPWSTNRDKDLPCSIITIPDKETPGGLECLYLRAISGIGDHHKNCWEKYLQCWDISNSGPTDQGKMQLYALIALCCSKDPGVSLRYLFGKAGNPVDLNHQCFIPLVEFIRKEIGS